jgi:hypothetical protein
MWKAVLGIVLGFTLGMTMLASATFQAKYETDNSDLGHVVMYGYTSGNVLTPILVNSDGAIKTY